MSESKGFHIYGPIFSSLRASQVVIDFDMFDGIKFSNDASRQKYYETNIQQLIISMACHAPYNRVDTLPALTCLEKLRLQFYKEVRAIPDVFHPLFDLAHAEAFALADQLDTPLSSKLTMEEQSSTLENLLLTSINRIKTCEDKTINYHVTRLYIDVLNQKLFANCITQSELRGEVIVSFREFNSALSTFRELHDLITTRNIANDDYPQRNLLAKFKTFNSNLQNYSLEADDIPELTKIMTKLANKFQRLLNVGAAPLNIAP